MSGPALYDGLWHRLIHQGALEEARMVVGVAADLQIAQDTAPLQALAEMALEHWKGRTLVHAASEEEDLYPALAEAVGQNAVAALREEHAQLRRLVEQLEQSLVAGRYGEISQCLTALLGATEEHNAHEEAVLQQMPPQWPALLQARAAATNDASGACVEGEGASPLIQVRRPDPGQDG
ncbi:MAG: hemerythrin domain-containing protein [Firmicutes bacterium]|nr:hemerythrin domain-containing protein [Bacillota bacterium]